MVTGSVLANFRWFHRFKLLAVCFLVLCLFILMFHFRIFSNYFKITQRLLFFVTFLRKLSCWLTSLNVPSLLFPPSRSFIWEMKLKLDMLDRTQKLFYPVKMALARANPTCCSFLNVLVMLRNPNLICHVCPKWAVCVIAEHFCLVSGSDSKDRWHG